MTTTHYIVRRKSDGKWRNRENDSWADLRDGATKFSYDDIRDFASIAPYTIYDLIEVTVTTTERVVNLAPLEG